MEIENDPSEIKPIVTAMGHISLQRKSIYLKKKVFLYKEKPYLVFTLNKILGKLGL